jgi:hypothetical protein
MKLERKVYESSSQKAKDFFLGVGLLIGINVAFWVIPMLLNGMESSLYDFGFGGIFRSIFDVVRPIMWRVGFFLPFVVNIGAFIYFGRTRYWIARGMLGLIAFGLLITVLFSAACLILNGGRMYN